MRIVIELKRGAEPADRPQPALQAHLHAGGFSMILLADVKASRKRWA